MPLPMLIVLAEVASKVTVPPSCTNTPELVKDPATVNIAEGGERSVVPLPIVTSPFTSSFLLLVLSSTMSAVPEFERVRAFVTVVVPVPVPLKVMVGEPELAVKVRL